MSEDNICESCPQNNKAKTVKRYQEHDGAL